MVRLERIVIQGFKSFKRKTSIPFPEGFSVITGPNGSGKCVTGDTLVQLADGSLTRIDELVNKKIDENPTTGMDDGVLALGDSTQIMSLNPKTMKASPKRVEAFIKRTSPKRLVKIRTRSGREITTTEYHPLFILRDGKIKSVRADELSEGTRVAVPRSIDIESVGNNFYELIELIKEDDRVYVPFREEYRELVLKGKKASGLTWKGIAKKISVPLMSLNCLMNRQAINFAHLVRILSFAGLDKEGIAKAIPCIKSRVTGKKCRMIWKNSPEFSRFLGYNLAEGRLSTTSSQLWFTNGTQEIVEDYANLVEKLFDIKPSINEYKPGCWDVITYSHPLMKLMSKFGMSYKGTSGKTVSNLFLSNSSEEELSELLNGLYCGDGYVSKTSIEITMKNKGLAFAAQTVLMRMGIMSHVKKIVKVATNTGFSGEYYNVLVYGYDNFKVFNDKIWLVHPEKMRRVNKLCEYKDSNPNVDLLDANQLVKRTARELGINVKRSKKHFPRIDAYVYNQCLPSRYGIEHLVENLFEPVRTSGRESQSLLILKKICKSHILWDEITSIENIESREKWVYDLTVKDNHNFVANNIFVHNSNIGDSISFVLGRSSSKALRARKAHELVFQGSARKSASDDAKVALYFDNSRKILPLEEKSVCISRRLNKKGISTYRLNGKVTTRQQIVDMFALADLSADGHNIIQQGDVNHIVEMDAVQRRKIIDEISGIGEYDEKRNKAQKELEKIDGRVREAEILINEKQSIMEKIKAERDAAIMYKDYESELASVRAAVIWKEYSSSMKGVEESEKEITEKEKESEDIEKKIAKHDGMLVEEEKKLEDLTRSVLKASTQIDITRKIEELRGHIERKRDRIESNEREIDRIEAMISRVSSFEARSNPALSAVKGMGGVRGSLSELIMVPGQYRIAAEVAAGGHMSDIVVDSTSNAVRCVKHLKANRIGRARFLPMDKIRGRETGNLPVGAVGWMSELIQHDPEYSGIVDYVFSGTACVKDIDKAKAIASKQRVRMVTMDGDLMEASGAITGGFYRKGGQSTPDTKKYDEERKALGKENEKLRIILRDLNEELEILAEKEKKTAKTTTLERERVKVDETLRRIREDRKELYERKLVLQQEIGKLSINRAKAEARFDNLKVQWKERAGNGEETTEEGYPKGLEDYVKMGLQRLKDVERETIQKIQQLGPVNLKAVEDFESLRTEFEDFREKVDRIVSEKNSIMETISHIEARRIETFSKSMDKVAKNFKQIYKELTGGDADLTLENPEDLESGLMIKAQPPGKKLLSLDSMSGGEKTLTAFTFLFAIQRHKPSPFYILDEADAALDKANTKKIVELIRKHAGLAQFIIISHNDALVREADQVYGISMEDGESKVMGLELGDKKNN